MGNLAKNWYRDSQIFEVRQAHPRTILVKDPPPGQHLHMFQTPLNPTSNPCCTKGKKNKIEDQTGVVYRIPCGGCNEDYIGETKRTVGERIMEHTAKIANNLFAIVEDYRKISHEPDLNNIKVVCREHKQKPRKVQEAIFIRKETIPTLNRDGGMNFQRHMIHF